jgi:hypothetical protein
MVRPYTEDNMYGKFQHEELAREEKPVAVRAQDVMILWFRKSKMVEFCVPGGMNDVGVICWQEMFKLDLESFSRTEDKENLKALLSYLTNCLEINKNDV